MLSAFSYMIRLSVPSIPHLVGGSLRELDPSFPFCQTIDDSLHREYGVAVANSSCTGLSAQ